MIINPTYRLEKAMARVGQQLGRDIMNHIYVYKAHHLVAGQFACATDGRVCAFVPVQITDSVELEAIGYWRITRRTWNDCQKKHDRSSGWVDIPLTEKAEVVSIGIPFDQLLEKFLEDSEPPGSFDMRPNYVQNCSQALGIPSDGHNFITPRAKHSIAMVGFNNRIDSQGIFYPPFAIMAIIKAYGQSVIMDYTARQYKSSPAAKLFQSAPVAPAAYHRKMSI